MNYEEKLKEAKRLYESANDDQKYVIESLFPELNESEDERIKKELIGFLQLHHPQFVGKRKQEKWIAWLEKQGGQEPIEWKDSDEKYLFWVLLSIQKDIAASEINGVNTKDLNDCVRWLYSLKQRIKGE